MHGTFQNTFFGCLVSVRCLWLGFVLHLQYTINFLSNIAPATHPRALNIYHHSSWPIRSIGQPRFYLRPTWSPALFIGEQVIHDMTSLARSVSPMTSVAHLHRTLLTTNGCHHNAQGPAPAIVSVVDQGARVASQTNVIPGSAIEEKRTLTLFKLKWVNDKLKLMGKS